VSDARDPRCATAGGGSSDITRIRSIGNRLLTAVVNLLWSTSYTDLCYGYNAFWRRYVSVLGLETTSPSPAGDGRLWGDGFEIETLIHIRVAQEELRVVEVPSFEHPRIHGVSNLSAFSDGLRVLTTILVERRRSRREASDTSVPTVQGSGPSRVQRLFVRMLFVLHSTDGGRRVHRGGITSRPATNLTVSRGLVQPQRPGNAGPPADAVKRQPNTIDKSSD